MTWDMWCDIISGMKFSGSVWTLEEGCLLEQLLCEGTLPLACERCGHPLKHHQFDAKGGETVRSFCNVGSCFDHNEHSLCPSYVGTYVEH